MFSAAKSIGITIPTQSSFPKTLSSGVTIAHSSLYSSEMQSNEKQNDMRPLSKCNNISATINFMAKFSLLTSASVAIFLNIHFVML